MTYINTHAIVKELIAAKFTEQQAEAITNTIEQFATKDELVETKEGLVTKADLKIAVTDLKSEISGIKGEIRGIKSEIANIKWVIPMYFGLMIVLLKYLLN